MSNLIRIFKSKWFSKWAKKEKLTDKQLHKTICEMSDGLVGNDLGKSIFKKRIAIQGQGKNGGFRSLIAYKVKDKAFFVYGFSKSVKSNVSTNELKALQVLAENLLEHSDKTLKQLIELKELSEVQDYE